MSTYFNLPHINVKDVVEQFKNLPSEEAEAMRSGMEE